MLQHHLLDVAKPQAEGERVPHTVADGWNGRGRSRCGKRRLLPGDEFHSGSRQGVAGFEQAFEKCSGLLRSHGREPSLAGIQAADARDEQEIQRLLQHRRDPDVFALRPIP